LNYNEYQLATTITDIRPQQGELNIRLVCSVLGLIEELEELDIISMVTEDEKVIFDDIEGVKSEVGDCLYYIASIGIETDITMKELTERPLKPNAGDISIAKLLKKTIRDYPEMILSDLGMPKIYREPLHDYLAWNVQLVLPMYVNIEEAMEYNIKKLLDRKMKNTIKGDGDKR